MAATSQLTGVIVLMPKENSNTRAIFWYFSLLRRELLVEGLQLVALSVADTLLPQLQEATVRLSLKAPRLYP